MAKKTLLIDFDATLATYNGWQGPDVLGEPLENSRHAMLILAREYNLVCFTTRPAEPVDRWLKAHGFPHMRVTNRKDPAFLQIDDRALTFQGQWTQDFIERIRSFSPWWGKTTTDHVSDQASSQSSQVP